MVSQKKKQPGMYFFIIITSRYVCWLVGSLSWRKKQQRIISKSTEMNESRVLGRIDEHTKYGEYEFERQINHKAKISRKNTLTRA